MGTKEVETLNGESVSISILNGTGVDGASLILNGNVSVVTPDIEATNGVIHEIDNGTL